MLEQPNRNSSDIIDEILAELNIMVFIPDEKVKQAELAMSREHIKYCLLELVNNEIYLLERLKHSETERFKK